VVLNFGNHSLALEAAAGHQMLPVMVVLVVPGLTVLVVVAVGMALIHLQVAAAMTVALAS
jgi:uncharacterized membrane protein YjgN (DUF898 family)